MKGLVVVLILFTVAFWSVFQISKSYFSGFLAFLVASVVTVCVALGMIAPMGMKEGLTHDTTFANLMVDGQLRTTPTNSSLTDLTFTGWRLNGRTHGSIA